MKILIKGGVWKNTEDEILKAAVMKYGKNQWARVASLLNRKSAKQCKARWYEWLDPSIKKTEWSKEEEEKLLHLAKLMPNQWRTIAPIVGRTAAQCMEQYERLLDMAQEGGVSSEAAGEEARRLRPGEIDPAPETKPARPDPIDMDEDEKEMLSEARARLANTKGKKAKRKARERQLGEARRLALVQKRRELKAAGIESSLPGVKNKRKYMDYRVEIPFQKIPPAGFYDVGQEREESSKMTLDPEVDGMEISRMENRHHREEEQKEQQRDRKRLKTLFKANAPQAVMAIAAQNDPAAVRRRGVLSLPNPQVSEAELEEIVKSSSRLLPMAPPTAGAPTQSLIGDYSATPAGSTPLRTPMQENTVLQEARNLRVLRDMTPLSGESEEPLPELIGGTGFAGVTPLNTRLSTPNVLASNSSSGRLGSASATPLLTNNANATPQSSVGSRTPLRDQFGLNQQSDVTRSVRAERMREKHQRAVLAARLKGLPEPEFTYEVSVPAGVTEDDAMEVTDGGVEDAADIAERIHRLQKEEAELEDRRRSAVLRRQLPRPASVNTTLRVPVEGEELIPSTDGDAAVMAEVSRAVCEEMVMLLSHDEYAHPDPNRKSKRRPVPVDMEFLDDALLQQARELIESEISNIKHQGFLPADINASSFDEAWDALHRDIIYVPPSNSQASGKYADVTSLSKAEVIVIIFVPFINSLQLLSALSYQFTVLKSRFDKDAKRAAKLEQKLKVTTQGYSMRADKLDAAIKEEFEGCATADIEYGI